MLLQKIWFLGLFDLKTGIDFAHFGLESGIVFEGTVSGFLHITRVLNTNLDAFHASVSQLIKGPKNVK